MREFILMQDELEKLLKYLPNKGIVLLRGDLASGKTSLVQALLKKLNFDEKPNSPTFSLMQSYEKEAKKIYHYDIYQVGLRGILQNGLFENFFEEGLHLVEWGDENLEKALKKMGIKPYIVEIFPLNSKRKYVIYE
ncbi:tRNA (adenosine(37)-N6)-threonylcarbamoyltransferase complex ATPase subunit type 1 TsaE [Campylobacter vulpis]|uniref:tRNA (adenosine(37)-N6)-threonylcarbamoyltransferase complex ATPase subunit type 1 TsaE n=1 Tax=Campylobacter vulpis TaxID=1655500 RepID=UPI001BD02213|nr:tRNA (adenosine(37)-N6)-threonylcarbamoyltransferase complex ATPase subunit type 1 TsaE [Campylobacter vulpis]